MRRKNLFRKITNSCLIFVLAIALCPMQSFASENISDLQENAINELPINVVNTNVSNNGSIVTNVETVDTYATYTDPKTGIKPGNLNVNVQITYNEADIEGATIELPYGFNPSSGDAVFANFSMNTPIFSLVTPQQPSSESVVEGFEEQADKLVIKLKPTRVGTENISLQFAFNEDYDGKIPANQVIWNDIRTIVKNQEGEVITQSEAKDIITSAIDGMNTQILVEDGREVVYGTQVEARVYYYNNYRNISKLDVSDPSVNKLYIEVPTGSTLSQDYANYYGNNTVTSEQDSSVAPGYTRYYRQLTDDADTFKFWETMGDTESCFYFIDGGFNVPESYPNGENFKLKIGVIYKKINDQVRERTSEFEFRKEEAPDFKFNVTNTHSNSWPDKNLTIVSPNGIDNDQYKDERYTWAAGYWEYGNGWTTKNEGKVPVKNTRLVLKQPEGSAKLNYGQLEAFIYNDNGQPRGKINVKLEIKNALTGEVRTVDAGTDSSVNVNLPRLGENEFIDKVIATPMGLDGSTEGELPVRNGLAIRYIPERWENNKFPDGTVIPTEKVSIVTMSWSIDYLDETDSQNPQLTTKQGSDWDVYYAPSQTTQAYTQLKSVDSKGKKPGDTVNYELIGYNGVNAMGEWVNPELGIAVPKELQLQNPEEFKDFVNKKTNQTLSGAVKVTLVASDDKCNYYKLNVEGNAPMNGDLAAFSIPLTFQVKEGTKPGVYEVPFTTSANNRPSFVQVKQPTNNLTNEQASCLGYNNANESSYTGTTSGHDSLEVSFGSNISAKTAARPSNTSNWEEGGVIGVAPGDNPQMKLSVVNSGNTTIGDVRLYNVLPYNGDDRGSTGNITFNGIDELPEGSVYYTTKPANELPAYNTNLQEWDDAKLQELGFSTQAPANIADTTAIFVIYNGEDVDALQTADFVMNFSVPQADNQTAVSRFQYSAREQGSITSINAVSEDVVVSTEVVKVNFEQNLPTYLAPGVSEATNFPKNFAVSLDGSGRANIQIPNQVPRLIGYKFSGWEDEAGTIYQPGEVINYTSTRVKGEVTLKATWEKQEVEVTFNENYGNAPQTKTVTYEFGEELSPKAMTPTRKGFTLLGWSKDKTSTTAEVQLDGVVDFEGPITLYAIWQFDGMLPGQDGEDGTDDDVQVTPGDGEFGPNEDGSVTLPGDEENKGEITFPNNPDNNGTVTVPGGSTVNPDGTVELPNGEVVKPNPDGSIELPGQDGDIDNPNHEDNPVIKPGGNGDATINPDGSITVPDGGDVTFPNNPDNDDITQIPGGSTVKPDGTVETPDGGVVRPNPDGGVELPGNDGKLPAPDNTDNPVVKPEGDGPIVVNPDGSVTLPDDENGNITYPNNPDNNGSITIPGGSTVNPDGSVTVPGGVVDTEEDGSIILPGQDGNLGTDDDVIVKPGGNGDATINPDGSVDLPNGGDVSFPGKPDAGMEVPPGSNVGQDGTVTAPNGDQSRPNVDGTITVPGHDNQFGTADDGIIKPNGPNKPVLNEDGTITLPDGGVITFPGLGDCEIVIEPTGYVDSRGVVTNPGVDGIINTADDEVIDPAVVCAIEPTVTPEQTKPTNTGAMNNMIMLLLVVAVSSVVVIGLRRRK